MSDETRLIPADKVAELLGISKRTLWRLLSAGNLPEPVRLGSVVRWKKDELDDWISGGCKSLQRRNN
jgi:prophage regulatory protein